jgi:Zn-finger nucleic acid-binding protein
MQYPSSWRGCSARHHHGATVGSMDTLTCPRCGSEMESRPLTNVGGDAEVSRCPEGHGVFLSRIDLGALIEAENDWHSHAGQHTAPMPKITADMDIPPSVSPASRAWVETLFR